MDITIHSSFLPHSDPDASLAFFRDTLGFEVRSDVGYKGMRWITGGPADQPGTSIVLYPTEATPGITDDERRTVTEMPVLSPVGEDGRLRRAEAEDYDLATAALVAVSRFGSEYGSLVRCVSLRGLVAGYSIRLGRAHVVDVEIGRPSPASAGR